MSSKRTHRKRLSVAFLAAGALVVSSCGFVGGSSSDEKTLVFGGFGGSQQTAMEEKVIPAFEKKYDVKVTYVTGTSDELMAKARQKSSGLDVIWTNATTHYAGKQAALFSRLDPKLVDNLDDVYDFAKDPDDVGVATGVQSVGLTYNTKIFKTRGWQVPTSWKDLLDKRYRGHLAGYNIPIGYANLLLVEFARLYGGSPGNLEPGWQALQRMNKLSGAWVSPPAQMTSMVAEGSAWIAYNGSSRAYASKSAGDPVGFVNPSEGALAYPQYFDVLKTAPQGELAQKFVNFALSAQAQQDMAAVAMLGPVNDTVKLADDVAKTVPYGKDAIASLVQIDSDPLNASLDEALKRWTRLVGGA